MKIRAGRGRTRGDNRVMDFAVTGRRTIRIANDSTAKTVREKTVGRQVSFRAVRHLKNRLGQVVTPGSNVPRIHGVCQGGLVTYHEDIITGPPMCPPAFILVEAGIRIKFNAASRIKLEMTLVGLTPSHLRIPNAVAPNIGGPPKFPHYDQLGT